MLSASLHHATRASALPAVGRGYELNMKLESPIPWMPRPAYLDGTLAADVGLDPLNLVTSYNSLAVPAIILEETVDEPSEGLTNVKRVVNQKFAVSEIILGADTEDPKR